MVAVVTVITGCSGAEPGATTSAPSEVQPAGATEGADANPTEEQTDSSKTYSYDDYLGELSRRAGFSEPPPVETRRVLQDGLEHGDLVQACLAESGFPRDERDGSISVGDQLSAFNEAMYTCSASYRLDDRLYEPFTASQIRFIREFWIESTIPCYAALGLEVPPPPSTETVVGTWDSLEKYHPQDGLHELNLSFAEMENATRACPDLPPAAEIWER